MAYEAARLADPEKADAYLYRLRRATILEGRQTTLDEELMRVAEETGMDMNLFRQHYTDGSALPLSGATWNTPALSGFAVFRLA